MGGRLQDKVIIVAGAGWIGSGLARTFAKEGAKVVIGDLDGDAAVTLAKELEASGAKAVGAALDGSQEASVKELVQLATSTFGALHGMHANFVSTVDGRHPGGVVDLPLELYDEAMATNARGYVICSKYAIPAMIESGGGAMVYTSSAEAFTPNKIRLAYAMSKAALHALSRHVATRYGRDGIRANVICPGYIGEGRPNTDPKLAERIKGMAAVKSRLGKPEDIAAMSAFLLSDEAGYVTGQVLSVDGGATMRP